MLKSPEVVGSRQQSVGSEWNAMLLIIGHYLAFESITAAANAHMAYYKSLSNNVFIFYFQQNVHKVNF